MHPRKGAEVLSAGPGEQWVIVADLVIDDESMSVVLSAAERIEALHRDMPRSSIVRVRAVPDGMDEVRGLRAPGTGLRA